MAHRFRLAVVLALGLMPQVSSAQSNVPMYLDQNITAGVIGSNTDRNSVVMGNQMLAHLQAQHAMMRYAQFEAIGQARIQQGRASTAFAPTPASALASTTNDATQRAQIQQALNAFVATQRAKGLRVNDLADCRALAFHMGYYGFRGEDPGTARLEGTRRQIRGVMIADATLQGMPDPEKQMMCERWAVGALVAAAARDASRRASGPDRAALVERAEAMGAAVLGQMVPFGMTAQGLELTPDGFGDRGARLAASGVAPRFTRNPAHPSTTSYEHVFSAPAGTGRRLLDRCLRTVREHGGSDEELGDIYAAGYVMLFELREMGRITVSPAGWQRAREYERAEFTKLPDWQRLTDAQKQASADRFCMDVARLVELREVNARQVATATRPTDPIKAVLWVPPISNAGSVAEQANELLRRTFTGVWGQTLDRLVRQP